MSIVRTKRKKNNFSIIDNSGLRDGALSWKATGMLAFLMTKPDDWRICVSNLVSSKTDGRDSTISALTELQKAGYVYLQRYRVQGKFESEYIVFETQEDLLEWQNDEQNNHNGKTVTAEPRRENRDGLTVTENPHQLINKELNTELPITDLTNSPLPPAGEKESGEEESSSVEVEVLDPRTAFSVERTKSKQAYLDEPKVSDQGQGSAASKITENYRYGRNQPQYPKNINGSDRLPWDTQDPGKFDPAFEKHMAKWLIKTTIYQKLMPGELQTQVRKHIFGGKCNLETRGKLQIEWDAMHEATTSEDDFGLNIGQISKALDMESKKQRIGNAIEHL